MSKRPLLALLLLLASACTLQRTQQSASLAMDDHSAHMSATDLQAPVIRASRADQQGNTALPPSAATAEARIKGSPRHGEWVKIAYDAGGKDSLMAWVVYPVSRAKAPVVVVVHEIFGLSMWVRGVADQVAAEGFIAIAPDFLSRVRGGPSSVELPSNEATGLIRGVDAAEKNRIVNAAANFAMMQPSAEQRYGIIGYCWGGAAVFDHAINGGVKGFGGGVAFYGLPPMGSGQRATATSTAIPASFMVDSLKKIKSPVMLLSGTGDARITAAMPALDSLMKSLGKAYSGTNYEGAIHGFLRAQDDQRAPRGAAVNANGDTTRKAETQEAVAAELAANLAATKDGWPKTVAFLKKNLGVK